MDEQADSLPPWVGNPSLAAAYLEQIQTLAAEMAAGAGHEINNPLATILGHVQLLLRGETDPDRRKSLEAIGGQAVRIRDMIGDLMLFARPPEPTLAVCDVAAVVREVVSRLQQEAGTRRIRIETTCEAVSAITTDAAQLRVVVACLIRNAFEAMSDGGTISVRVTAGRYPGSGGDADTTATGVTIRVDDTGKGFGPDELRMAFDPFFSGRQAGRGLGFGLPKCQAILSQLGGAIVVENQPDLGARATVWLPETPSDSRLTVWPF